MFQPSALASLAVLYDDMKNICQLKYRELAFYILIAPLEVSWWWMVCQLGKHAWSYFR